jgi:hypothetical protein
VSAVRNYVSEEHIGSIIRMESSSELVTVNVSNSLMLSTLMMKTILSSETSVLIRATQHHMPEDDILHSHRRENLKSYIALTGWTL